MTSRWPEALLGTVKITAMIMLVIIGAYFLNYALTSAGLGQQLTDLLENRPRRLWHANGGDRAVHRARLLHRDAVLMVATIPIVVPIIAGLGFDKVWFGMLMIVLIEMALITPPVGLNLYVVQGARTKGSMNEVMVGVIPYVFVMLAWSRPRRLSRPRALPRRRSLPRTRKDYPMTLRLTFHVGHAALALDNAVVAGWTGRDQARRTSYRGAPRSACPPSRRRCITASAPNS